MGSTTRDGDSPVNEIQVNVAGSRVQRDTRNPVGSRRDHPPSLNTPRWPIVEKYREGKVKRTPGGEWNRIWNWMLTSKGSASDLVLFVERANELWYVARLRCWSTGAVEKSSLNRARVTCCRPETGWPIHEQVEVTVKGYGGPNLYLLKKVRMTCG